VAADEKGLEQTQLLIANSRGDPMKPYDELTRLGRLRRLRKLAQVALDAYGLPDARLTFLQYEGNVIFRVDGPGPAPARGWNGTYTPNRYVLRIHTSTDTEAIASELIWLAALSRDAGLPVPEPVSTLRGELLTTLTTPGVPDGRVVSLMHWVDGRRLGQGYRPLHARACGRLMGQLHAYAAGWQPPQGFSRPHWDWEGQFGKDGMLGRFPVEELVASMPLPYQEPFKVVTRQVRDVMAGFGKGPDAYGMVHADMYAENVLFKDGAAYPIDFDDCGFGYWMYDIGITLSEWRWSADWPRLRDAFLDGYAQVRALPASQLAQLDLFVAERYAELTLWGTAHIRYEPQLRLEHEKWRNAAGDNLVRYSKRG
jgi:Ser/Thr protein kinase RdoA (MazF antagonist)